MKTEELEKFTRDVLVDMLTPGLKSTLDKLLSGGASVQQVRDIMQHTVRRHARKENSFTEMAVMEYLDRMEKEPKKPAAPAKVQ